MLAISRCVSGSVGPIVAEHSFSSALTATAATLTAVIDAARKAGGNNGARLTAATNKVPKAGSIIVIASDSIAGDATAPPTPRITFS
jgi:hypothetical protein